MSRPVVLDESEALALPVKATCQYDTGSMYDCGPACSAGATHRLTVNGYCGWYSLDLCERHVAASQGRAYPYPNNVRLITDLRREVR